MPQSFADFKTNLRAGLRLAFFRPCELSDFRFNLDQLVLLLILDLILRIVADYLSVVPNPEFNTYALPVYALNQISLFAVAYLLGRAINKNNVVLLLFVIGNSYAPLEAIFHFILAYGTKHATTAKPVLWFGYIVWFYVIALLFRSLYLVSGRSKRHTISALVLIMMVSETNYRFYRDYEEFWYAEENIENEREDLDPYAAYRDLDGETLLYRQPAILNKALAELKPQRKNKTDIFFVGFASYATEDVFSKEVTYAKQLLDKRFDTQGHSLNLINHLKTLEQVPLATASNLALSLKRIGKIMNTEEDILFLYLTSHGSKQHELSVNFWPLVLNDITPERLNTMLNDAGIKWRMIIVSACYSGGYIKPLQGATTLVATASAADKTSFGCGTESEFTYFGEALFKDQLSRESSFITALQEAVKSINQREIHEKKTASYPQLSIGSQMEKKLNLLATENQHRQCKAAKPQSSGC